MVLCHLLVTNQAQFCELPKNEHICAAILNISGQNYFKTRYVLLGAIFSTISELRYCDKGEPSIDKIYVLTFRASEALKRSLDLLYHSSVFTDVDTFT